MGGKEVRIFLPGEPGVPPGTHRSPMIGGSGIGQLKAGGSNAIIIAGGPGVSPGSLNSPMIEG